MSNILGNGHQEFRAMVSTLERSFGRSGVFYIGVLERLRHAYVTRSVEQTLGRKGIAVDSCQLHQTSLQDLDRRLQKARAKEERAVLVFWSLEHLPQSEIKQTLRGLCSARERLSQSTLKGKTSVPVVLLVDQTLYRKYFGVFAMDLIDGVSHFFLKE
jgi:hypothetical protein